MDFDELKEKLTKHGQDHVLRFWDVLSSDERERLYAEVSRIDLEYVTRSFQNCMEGLKQAQETLDDHLDPLPENVVGSVVRTDPDTLKMYESDGVLIKLISLWV